MKRFFITTPVLIIMILVGAGCAVSPDKQEPIAVPVETPEDVLVNSFEECVAAGNLVMKSYPRKCRAGGEEFVEEIDIPIKEPVDQICVDTCGDGECAEIVCLGSGCSCAETPETCPVDCW